MNLPINDQAMWQSVKEAAAKLSRLRLFLYILAAVIIIMVLSFLFFIKPHYSSGNKALEKELKALQKEYGKLQQQSTVDSLRIVHDKDSIKTISLQRDSVYALLPLKDKIIEEIKLKYAKVQNSYNNIPDDSLQRVFAEKFEQH